MTDRAMPARLILLAALLLAALLGWRTAAPPDPLPASAPGEVFSGGRAMADVRAIFARPHPIGSVENARVRAGLAARMAALGLRVSARPGVAAKAVDVKSGVRWLEGGSVVNLVGLLPGRGRAAPALAVMAHYDSVPSSSGAADDGAGVAAALEMARVLRAIGPPARDVLFLFTDGEEAGLLGARAFFARDPLARHVGMVVNMDMRGDAGRAVLYETGREPGGLVALYRRSAIHPTTDSIAAFVKKQIRNNSDFAVAVDHGLPGVNFAFIGNQFDYHAASSTPATMDPGTLQNLGDQAWAMVRPLAREPWPAPAPDSAYASVLGRFTVQYPLWGGWLLLAGAAAFLLLGVRATRLGLGELLRSMGAATWLLAVLLLGFQAARALSGVPFGFIEVRPLLARWPVFEGALGLIGLGLALAAFAPPRRAVAAAAPVIVALVTIAAGLTLGVPWWWPAALGLVAALLGWTCFARAPAEGAAPLGLAALVLLLAALAQVLAPQANVMLSWAACGGSLLAWAASRWRGLPALAAIAVAGALLAAQIGAMAHLLLLTVGENVPEAIAPIVLLIVLALAVPLAAAARTRGLGAAGAGIVALALGLMLVVRWTDYASPARPRATQALYLADTGTGRFWRVSNLATIDRWTDAALRADGGTPRRTTLLPSYAKATIAPAQPIAVTPPRVTSARDAAGRVLLTVTPGAPTREVRLWLTTSVPLRRLRVNGLPVQLPARAGETIAIGWAAPGTALRIAIEPAGPGRITGRVAALQDGWPADARALPPRRPDEMPWYNAGSTIVWAPVAVRF